MRKEEVACGFVFALLMLAVGTPIAQAGDPIQVYQDRAAWEAAASAAGLDTGLETFDGFADTFPDGNLPDFSVGPIDFATNDVGFTGDSGISGGALFHNLDEVFFRSENISVALGAELRGIAFDHVLNTAQGDEIEFDISSDLFRFFAEEPENPGSTFLGFLAEPGVLGTNILLDFAAQSGGWDSFDNMRVAFVPERQIGPYYVADGDASRMFIIRSGSDFDEVTTYSLAYPIAVRSTVLLGERDDLEAREYTLEGLPTGRTFTGNGVFSQLLDGTTDGVQFNYGIKCCQGPTFSVVVADLDWTNSAELFPIPVSGAGITYDTRTNHLFTTSLGDSLVREYDLSGTLIGSFSVAGTSGTLVGLAYEQATDTLWAKNRGGDTLYEFSKTGALLETVVVSGLSPSTNDVGGEIRIRPMLDFESLQHGDGNTTVVGANYTEDGFTIAGTGLSTFGTLEGRFTGSTALFEGQVGAEIVLTRTDGGRFDIISIDLAELNGDQSPGVAIDFTGDLPNGGTVTQSFQLDGAAFGPEIFLFSPEFRDLTAVRWNQLSPFHQFDNIVVPEPSAALLHAAALLALAGLAAWRTTRRRAP